MLQYIPTALEILDKPIYYGTMMGRFRKNAFGWGIILWLIGYLLGIFLFPFVPTSWLGWVITPIGTAITLWVIFQKIHRQTLAEYFQVGLTWLLIAVVLDFFLLVLPFSLAETYYKFDVFLYYALTLALPIFVGWKKLQKGRR